MCVRVGERPLVGERRVASSCDGVPGRRYQQRAYRLAECETGRGILRGRPTSGSTDSEASPSLATPTRMGWYWDRNPAAAVVPQPPTVALRNNCSLIECGGTASASRLDELQRARVEILFVTRRRHRSSHCVPRSRPTEEIRSRYAPRNRGPSMVSPTSPTCGACSSGCSAAARPGPMASTRCAPKCSTRDIPFLAFCGGGSA